MSVSRRHFILGTGAFCVVLGGVAALRHSYRDDVLAALSRSFGEDVAGSPLASEFADDLITALARNGTLPSRREALLNRYSHALRSKGYGKAKNTDNWAVSSFVKSTNVVLSFERGDELEYFGLFDPYNESTCLNTLSALAL